MDDNRFKKEFDDKFTDAVQWFFDHKQREQHYEKQSKHWVWQRGFWLLTLGVAVGAIAAKAA